MTDVDQAQVVDLQMAAPVISPVKPFGPGSLRGEVSLTLNTVQALALFKGRKSSKDGVPGIPSVYQFADYVKKIGILVTAGDPYADWAMIQVESLLDSCGDQLKGWHLAMKAKLQSAPGFTIDVAQSEEPHVVSLQLSSPYAYSAAQLIGQYDALVAVMLTGQYVGMFDADIVEEKVRAGRSAVRHIFHAARDFRFSGVTREDIEQRTEAALEAIEARGELPPGILDRSEQPRFRFKTKTN